MLAIRLVLLAIEEYFGAVTEGNTSFCDNMGVIHTFEKESKRVPPGKSNGNILRVLRSVQTRTRSKYSHKHVKGHQLKEIAFCHLKFEAKLNKHCDKWAKGALTEYMLDINRCVGAVGKKLQVLPLEAARVFIGGVKQTTDLAKGLRDTIGTASALAHYKE